MPNIGLFFSWGIIGIGLSLRRKNAAPFSPRLLFFFYEMRWAFLEAWPVLKRNSSFFLAEPLSGDKENSSGFAIKLVSSSF